MIFHPTVEQIFESMIDRIGRSIVLHADFGKKATLSYSGGKDSSILLLFYEYLHKKYLIPRPAIFHLNHQIRENERQENDIESFITSRFPHALVKKKIFRS